MKHTYLKLTCIIAPLAIAACATPKPEPAPLPQSLEGTAMPVLASQQAPSASATTKPAAKPSMTSGDLPAGHPSIAELIAQRQKMKANAKMNGELPAGHPPISGMKKTPAATLPSEHPELPAGHPPLPGNQPQLPAGHPPLPQQDGKALPTASTRPAAAIGTIRVRALQGTANGPKIGVLPFTVDLYHGEKLLDKIEGKLDEKGAVAIDSIPTELMPVVRISYNGVEYTGGGEVNDGSKPEQPIEITVYETTEAAPAWQIKMQHVMLEPTVDGVQVREMLSVENPTDRAWIGKLGADNKRSSIAFPVPAGAADVKFAGGFHDCCTKVADGKIISEMPVVPGTTQYHIVYTLPVSGGKANYAVTTPAAVSHMMMMISDDGSSVAAQGVESGGLTTMGNGKTRFYKAMNVAAGTEIKLAFSNITATAAATGASPRGSSTGMAKTVAGAGGLAIFLVGGMFLLRKGPSNAKKH